MASKSISKLARSQPPSASPMSLDHSLQVFLQSRTITTSKCISQLTRLRQPHSHGHGLQVHLQTSLISASECISKPAGSQPPSVSPFSLDYGPQVCMIIASRYISKLAQSHSASLSSLDYELQVYHQIRSIPVSKCKSKLAQSWPQSASLSSLDHDVVKRWS